MPHDRELLDRLVAFAPIKFGGEVFRATRRGLDPLAEVARRAVALNISSAALVTGSRMIPFAENGPCKSARRASARRFLGAFSAIPRRGRSILSALA